MEDIYQNSLSFEGFDYRNEHEVLGTLDEVEPIVLRTEAVALQSVQEGIRIVGNGSENRCCDASHGNVLPTTMRGCKEDHSFGRTVYASIQIRVVGHYESLSQHGTVNLGFQSLAFAGNIPSSTATHQDCGR